MILVKWAAWLHNKLGCNCGNCGNIEYYHHCRIKGMMIVYDWQYCCCWKESP